jgi:hypothetical protein
VLLAPQGLVLTFAQWLTALLSRKPQSEGD